MNIKTKKFIEKIALFGGVIAVLFEWIAFIIFYLNTYSNFGNITALSDFATFPQTRLTFAICLSIAAISFWIFVKLHFNKHFNPSVNVFTFSMLSYLLMALIPYNPENSLSDITHRILAMSFTISFIIGMYLTAKGGVDKNIKTFSQTLAIISGVLALAIFFIPGKSLFFILEMMIFFLCQLWSIGITYFVYKLYSKN